MANSSRSCKKLNRKKYPHFAIHAQRGWAQAVLRSRELSCAPHMHPTDDLRLGHTQCMAPAQASQKIPHSLRSRVVFLFSRISASWISLPWAWQEWLLLHFQTCWSATPCHSLNTCLEIKVKIICSCLYESKTHTVLELNKSSWWSGEIGWLL